MNLNTIIFRNLKKNIRNYYLYVFALIFSVGLYFSFVTLQYDPSMDEAKGTVKGAAALGAASVLLVAIVAVFLLYANTIFIKRRSKEIGLFQLIGLTKGRIFRILTAENLILYFGSMVIGIAAGFAASRLILMILFKILGVDELAALRFSPEALTQTVIVFALIYVLIMIMNYLFIVRQSILSLFRVVSTAQQRVSKMSLLEILLGVLGIALILGGYYVSSELFGGRFTEMGDLMWAMIFILASVIIGTYLFYKGSVSFIFNAIRKSKNGYLSIGEVLSLSSIMFRMKSNAMLLTVITTVSALAIGLLSLSYISYYSAETSAKNSVPHDFSFADEQVKEDFISELDSHLIAYEVIHRQPITAEMDASKLMSNSTFADETIATPVLSETMVGGIELEPGEAVFMGYDDSLSSFMTIANTGEFNLIGRNGTEIHQKLIGIKKEAVLSYFYGGLSPTVIVDETVYQQLHQDMNPELQTDDRANYYGVQLKDRSQVKEAHQIYKEMDLGVPSFSQYDFELNQRNNMGMIMFIVGFLGLTFLITSGCILYFKQMDESEEERPNYTILRKLGFTESNLMRGIRFKQLFNFGIPLIVGLCHSYFAVKSGWFLFGTELMAPMLIVMGLYTVLYSIFGILSVNYYKRVIKSSL
ncbi:FtsX-like permease family protein [Paenibacillus shunpengii]|uniref:FtsX-like permease family protein n=1 Tax=Paenibacillus shunpengii TaxID=2054424 RepID=A0ABW5SW32_9BACL|nr:ABC transporter permease [Paenibacillus sp. PDC88]SDW91429.1 bacitracin transport system permease protein [Paenibacillus sp. PDC88]